MDLLLLGAGMGIVGGLVPSPLHLIALSQVGINRWGRAIALLVGPPVGVDAVLLLVTLFFYRFVPHGIAHDVAYVGGVVLLIFAGYGLGARSGKEDSDVAASSSYTYASVAAATFSEVTSPGTWIYWLTIAGPILAEGRVKGYGHVVPFFAGGLLGYYGAALFSLWVLAWGASLHRHFKKHLFVAAHVLLLVLGVSYLVRAYFGG
jgi:threonine/homoserine/homoserine lactone efflux protein